MASFSKAMIIGNLGRDPEMRYTPNGRPVTEFSVAVNQSTKNQQTNEWVEATDWFRVTVWGDRAERTAEQLRKGNRVFVEGRFRTREFETKDGQKRISLEITADNVVSLEARVRDEDLDLETDDLPSAVGEDEGEDDDSDDLDVPEGVDESESEAAPAAID